LNANATQVYDDWLGREDSETWMSDLDQGESALDAAMSRLDRALGALEARLASHLTARADADPDLFERDRAELAAQLEAAKSREKALEAVAAEASAALGRAAAEVRAALQAEM
jgi:hypothetical protein